MDSTVEVADIGRVSVKKVNKLLIKNSKCEFKRFEFIKIYKGEVC